VLRSSATQSDPNAAGDRAGFGGNPKPEIVLAQPRRPLPFRPPPHRRFVRLVAAQKNVAGERLSLLLSEGHAQHSVRDRPLLPR
jgi:hypothetical protein